MQTTYTLNSCNVYMKILENTLHSLIREMLRFFYKWFPAFLFSTKWPEWQKISSGRSGENVYGKLLWVIYKLLDKWQEVIQINGEYTIEINSSWGFQRGKGWAQAEARTLLIYAAHWPTHCNMSLMSQAVSWTQIWVQARMPGYSLN